MVEHQFCKLKVLGSSPKLLKVACLSVGGIAAIAAGCKPVTLETRRFESYPTDQQFIDRQALKVTKTIGALVVESSGETPQKAAVDGQKLYARHKSA